MAESPKFEESLEKLEKLVEELESGELDLNEAMKRFESGVKLTKQLHASLEEAQRKVEKLMVGTDGEARVEPLDADEDTPAPKKSKSKKSGQDTLF